MARGRSRSWALWRVALAELCGTALLVLLSCLAGCGPSAASLPLHRALAAGFVVTLLVQVTYPSRLARSDRSFPYYDSM